MRGLEAWKQGDMERLAGWHMVMLWTASNLSVQHLFARKSLLPQSESLPNDQSAIFYYDFTPKIQVTDSGAGKHRCKVGLMGIPWGV